MALIHQLLRRGKLDVDLARGRIAQECDMHCVVGQVVREGRGLGLDVDNANQSQLSSQVSRGDRCSGAPQSMVDRLRNPFRRRTALRTHAVQLRGRKFETFLSHVACSSMTKRACGSAQGPVYYPQALRHFCGGSSAHCLPGC